MQPLYGTVTAGGKGVGPRILTREECPIVLLGAGENPSLTLATDDCNVPDKREELWCPACAQKENCLPLQPVEALPPALGMRLR